MRAGRGDTLEVVRRVVRHASPDWPLGVTRVECVAGRRFTGSARSARGAHLDAPLAARFARRRLVSPRVSPSVMSAVAVLRVVAAAPRAASARSATADRPGPSAASALPAPRSVPRASPAGASSAAPARRADALVARARKGLLADTLDGDDSKRAKKKDKKAKKAKSAPRGSDSVAGSLEPAFAGAASSSKPSRKNWILVGDANADFDAKPIKALVLANGNFCLVKWEDQIFCVDCNSTAYQYPLIDAELFYGPAGPAIRSPLDGTEYDLTTGDVLVWCPKNNPVRAALGTLKAAAEPVPLPVYAVEVDDASGDVFVNFVEKVASKRGFSNEAAGSVEGGKGVEIVMKEEAANGEGETAPSSSTTDGEGSTASSTEEGTSPVIVVGLALVAAAAVYLALNPGDTAAVDAAM